MEWISFFDRQPEDGQPIYYYGKYIGVWFGQYKYSPDDPVSPHIIHCKESLGVVDRMDTPWWMPYNPEMTRPHRPVNADGSARDYPDDYPRSREVWGDGGRWGFHEE